MGECTANLTVLEKELNYLECENGYQKMACEKCPIEQRNYCIKRDEGEIQ